MNLTLPENISYALVQPSVTPKGDVGVAPFIVAVDTREQHPFLFRGVGTTVYTHIQTLSTGDYSVVGFERAVCVERKSKEDLFGSVTSGRERFEREMARMEKFVRCCVVVEASLEEVRRGLSQSQVDPENVILTAISWAGRYRVPWMFCQHRADAERTTFKFLEFAWRDFVGSRKTKKTTDAQ